jgi:ATP-dependent DNA ligase
MESSGSRVAARYSVGDVTVACPSPAVGSDHPKLQEALAEIGETATEEDDEELEYQLGRIPDLTESLREAPVSVKRQVFEAFELQIRYDRIERRIEISATVSEAIADALENAKALRKEGLSVVVTDIAGARYVSRYHRTRIREITRHPS